MKDILIIFIVLLFVLLLISTFGGSLRQQPDHIIIVNSEEPMLSSDRVEYEYPTSEQPILQESTYEEDDSSREIGGDLSGYEISKTFAAFDT